MQFEQNPVNTLTPLPAQNIDTGLGLNRLAADPAGRHVGLRHRPVHAADRARRAALGQARAAPSAEVDRALRVLADHTRGMSFLIADGVVPSNEDRGYVLRRLMRRAIVQGRQIGIEPGLPAALRGGRARDDGRAYPELLEQADTVDMWLRTEEETFNRTLEQGLKMLEDVIERAARRGEEGIGADEAFRCTTRTASRSISRWSSRPSAASASTSRASSP